MFKYIHSAASFLYTYYKAYSTICAIPYKKISPNHSEGY
nr:MAG TPA: hypothetical protein [Caudoviricetes sp.]